MKITIEFKLADFVRWLLALLLLLAALSKIANPTEFLGSLAAYRLLPPGALLRCTAVVLPWLELLVGLLLITGGVRRAALTWAAMLCALFLLATGQAWARGLDINCGCFHLDFLGLEAHQGIWKFLESVSFAFVRAGILLAGAIYLLYHQPRVKPNSPLT